MKKKKKMTAEEENKLREEIEEATDPASEEYCEGSAFPEEEPESPDIVGDDFEAADGEEEAPGLTTGTIVKITLAGMFFLAALVSAILILATAKSDKIFTAVSVAGVDLRGMTVDEAAAALNAKAEEFCGNYAPKIVLPDRTEILPAETLGLEMDAEGAAEAAYLLGREKGAVGNTLARLGAGSGKPVELSPTYFYDAEAVRAWAEALAGKTDCAPTESKVNVDEEFEKITVYIGNNGQKLDVDALCAAVSAAALGERPEEIELGYTYTLSQAVDLNKIYAEVHRDVSDAYYDEKTCEIVEEQVGFGFDLEAANQKLRLASGGETVVIQMQTEYPKVTVNDLEKIYFTDVIGSCRTYGLGSYNRATNITLACQTLNGMVVPPGATFSYNQALGQRTSEKGYQYAGAYVNGRSVSEVGGGICQVSSTLYNAVLQANLEIVTRSEHIYIAGYVDLGMDATVSWGGPDFQFRNNTEHPIRIEAWVDGGYVNVRLMGTPTGVSVKMTYQILSSTPYTTTVTEDPGQVNDIGRNGMTVVTYRNVYDLDGNLLSSEVEDYSYYQRSDIVILKKDFDEQVQKKLEEEQKKKEEEEKQKLAEEEARRAAEEAAKANNP